MQFSLHNLTIQLQSDSRAVRQQAAMVLAGWLVDPPTATVDVALQLRLAESLPPLPAAPPIFTDGADRILHVYQPQPDTVWLHFLDGGLIEVPLRPPWRLSGVVTAGLLGVNGRLEDILFTSLAPVLRRHNLFLVHAFAASHRGQAVLLVGPSRSGKTTTGLNLLLHGWELLANDVVLLQPRADGVYALPMPGTLGIRAPTFALLPGLLARLGMVQPASVEVAAERLVPAGWGVPCRVTTLFFPALVGGEKTAVLPHNRAIALTQMLAESVDRWDSETFGTHLACLQAVCQQATPYQLELSRHVDTIPAQLAAALPNL